MNHVELMTVEDTFMIESIGLILAPPFEVPPTGRWENIRDELTVEISGGESLAVNGLFRLTHFNVKDPSESASKYWKVQLVLQGLSKEQVPIGSIVFGTQELKNIICNGS